MLKFISMLFIGAVLVTGSCQLPQSKRSTEKLFTLWQLPNQTPTQMMSYIIHTPHKKVLVIDGGNAGDAPYLRDFISNMGNSVEAWFISHPHSDHIGALDEILKKPDGMKIKVIYGSMPDAAWIKKYGDDEEFKVFENFKKTLNTSNFDVVELKLGSEFEIDSVRFEVLGIINPEITANAINNSSVVMRVSDSKKSVLFTGDLGVEGGDKLLKSPYADKLHADYVQMAHHGQNGVNEKFYRHVNASYCLWPTPIWLWDNDNGGGKDSGPWNTLKVRAWMEKLPVKRHYLMFEGLCKIE